MQLPSGNKPRRARFRHATGRRLSPTSLRHRIPQEHSHAFDPHRALRALLALCTAAGLASVAAPTATAAPGTGPTAVVAIGDSYISGEAGRWQGNSLTNSGSRNGTDRAWTGSAYDPSGCTAPPPAAVTARTPPRCAAPVRSRAP
ncbi:hypothetical protein STANM309S_05070 [Streptomyces tanashiensis]